MMRIVRLLYRCSPSFYLHHVPAVTGECGGRRWFCFKKGMEHRAPCKHIFSTYTHPQPVGWIKKILNVFMLHIKLKGKKYRLT